MRTLAIVLALTASAAALAEGRGVPFREARIAQKTRATHAPQNRWPAVSIFGAHVGEGLTYRPFDDKGRSRRDARAALEHLLRCRQTGQHHKVDPRLAEALYEVGTHYAGHRIEIFSGYRPKAFCDRAHSRHMSGSAVDFRVDGVDNKALVAYLRKTFHPAGVGYYPHDPHVHFDLDRTADTFWVQESPPAGDPLVDVAAGPQPVLPAVPVAVIEADVGTDELPLRETHEVHELKEPASEPAKDEPPASDPLLDEVPAS